MTTATQTLQCNKPTVGDLLGAAFPPLAFQFPRDLRTCGLDLSSIRSTCGLFKIFNRLTLDTHTYLISVNCISMISPLDDDSCREHHEICFSRLGSTFRQNVEKPPQLTASVSAKRRSAVSQKPWISLHLRGLEMCFNIFDGCDMIPKHIYSIRIHPWQFYQLCQDAVAESHPPVPDLPLLHSGECTGMDLFFSVVGAMLTFLYLSHLSHLRFYVLRLMFDVVSCCFHFSHSKSLEKNLSGASTRVWASNIPPRPVSMP